METKQVAQYELNCRERERLFLRIHCRAVVLLLVPILFAIGCTPGSPPDSASGDMVTEQPVEEELAEVVACGSTLGIGSWPMLYARETGLFHEYGLQVETHYMQSGSTGMTALLAGDADICHIGGSAVANAALAVEEPIIIAALINRQPYSFVVAPGIEQPDDLRGKVLAVSSPGSSSDTVLRIGLTKMGLDPESDVTIVSAGRQSDRLAALESGQVAGSLFTLQELGNATSAGYSVLMDIDDLEIPFQHTVFVTTRSYLAENEPTVTNFLKALLAAQAEMTRDPETGQDVIAGALLLETEQDRTNFYSIYTTVVEDFYIRYPFPSREGLNALLEQGRLGNPSARDITTDDFIDTTIVNELWESGFIDGLYEQE